MSQTLELSIEGTANDGDVLVVDGWPNFKTVPMPISKGKTIIKKEIVYQQSHSLPPVTSTKEQTSFPVGLFLWWLGALTLMQICVLFRINEKRKRSY